MDALRKHELLGEAVDELAAERGCTPPAVRDDDELWAVFRAFVNTRPPLPANERFLEVQDELLQGIIAESGVHSPEEAVPAAGESRMRLWRGDITTLAVDAVVNAANSQMLGCWMPGHHCIDNAIHTFAGVQLRIECARIMQAQDHEEPTGQAKVTPAYNLPSAHVIHTVGPIANGHPSALHREQLASCYGSCLDAAAERGFRSLAFCCISTGVFGFPQREAAEIAIRTVRAWLDARESDLVVIFNVFSADDEEIYRTLLGVRAERA